MLGAFQDVENALIAFAKEQEHYKSLKDSVAANRKAFDLSFQLYTEGMLEFLNVLVAQNSLYAAENALVQSHGNISTDLIALYKALGGGWEQPPSIPPAQSPGVRGEKSCARPGWRSPGGSVWGLA